VRRRPARPARPAQQERKDRLVRPARPALTVWTIRRHLRALDYANVVIRGLRNYYEANWADYYAENQAVEECATCHEGVAAVEDLRAVRMEGFEVDYDGDGEEGIASELEGMQKMLCKTIQAYVSEVADKAIAYNAMSYPYFFIDTNVDSEAGEDKAVGDNGFNVWTGRLLKAAYNYQTSKKDPGAYAHGGKYIIELLYDLI
jgi:hypothetical protein